MKVIVDTTVLNAETYYQKYLWEPSPAGDITFLPREIIPAKNLDLDFILTEMKKLGTGGELMIVTHSDPKGLKIPIIQGGKVSVLFSVMDKMLEINEAIRRRESIKSMPSNKIPQAWKDWFKDFEPGVRFDPGFENVNNWQAWVEKKYDEWYLRQGEQILKLPNPRNNLAYIIGLLNDVRHLKFERLEFRACRIGTDENELKTVARFIGAKKIVAPKEVRTFYGVIAKIETISDAKKFAQALKKLGGRTFQGISIGLQLGQNTFRVIATDESQAEVFLQRFISPKFSGSVAPFVIGGLEPAGKAVIAGKSHVFPLETEYKKLLGSLDASVAK